jgi:O-antigen ligase
LLVWDETILTFREHFWTGKGLNQPTSGVIFQNTEGSTSILTDAHNTFLSVAAQSGVFSLLAMLGFCGFLVGSGIKRWNLNVIETALVIAFLTAFVYQGLTGAFENARHLWVLVGMLLAASHLGSGAEQGFTHSGSVSPT